MTLAGARVCLTDGWSQPNGRRRNTFHSLGASAVALWGLEHRGDGTSGDQPRYTEMTENFCHELGIYQKQSSCFFQAVSAQTNISHNIFFNGPRAMVNFNDAFGTDYNQLLQLYVEYSTEMLRDIMLLCRGRAQLWLEHPVQQLS